MAEKFATVDEYISSFPEDVQVILEQMRRRLHKAVPGAGETISYEIPTITLEGKYVVYFAGWKHHVSLYPVPAGDEAFQAEIAPYVAGKGTLKFPLDEPIPYDLVEKVANMAWRVGRSDRSN